MSTPTTPTTPPAADSQATARATSTPEAPPAGGADTDAAGRRKDPAAEAAARRHELREEQAARAADRDAHTTQLGALGAQLTAARRGIIEGILTTGTDLRGDGSNMATLQRAADLWDILGGAPDQFFTEVGTLDAEALADFISAGTAGRDYLTKPHVENVPPANAARDALSSQMQTRTVAAGATPWADALR